MRMKVSGIEVGMTRSTAAIVAKFKSIQVITLFLNGPVKIYRVPRPGFREKKSSPPYFFSEKNLCPPPFFSRKKIIRPPVDGPGPGTP